MRAEQWSMEHGGPRDERPPMIELAFRMAVRWPSRIPKPQELMDEYGMHRATAYRWIRAMREARGLS